MPLNLVERIRFLPLTLIGGALGAVSLTLATLFVHPEPRLHEELFFMVRQEDNPFEITASKRLPILLPRPLGDFDVTAQVELPTGAELDVMFHIVQPTRDREEAGLFHARYDILKISTHSEGAAFVTRERGLFDRPEGGILVEPGLPATVHLQARGHMVRAEVAGKRTRWFESTDNRGGIIFALRGEGTGLVRYLNLQPLQRVQTSEPWLWASSGGAIVGLLVSLFGAGFWGALRALLALPVVAFFAGAGVLSMLAPEARPTLVGALAGAMSGLPLTIAIVLGVPWRTRLIAGVAVLGLWELTVRAESRRMAPFEDPRLSAYFGPGSGAITFDILEPQLKSFIVHKPSPAERRIVFAGGRGWFEAGGVRAPEHNLGPIATAQVGKLLAAKVDGVVVPTLYASSAQQLALLDRFIDGPFDPDVVVFAISGDELEPSERFAPTSVLLGEVEQPWSLGLELVRAWRLALRGDVPSGTPESLRKTLAGLAELARRSEFAVVLYAPEPLDAALDRVVRDAVGRFGWPVLHRADSESTVDTAIRHADTLAALLRR